MFEYVIDLGLKPARPYTPRTIDNIDLIVLHHFESDTSVEGVHAYHISKGHKGIDYNAVVRLDGSVVWGRGLLFEGGHTNNSQPETKGVNARSIGIVFQGDFNKRIMSKEQLKAGEQFIADCVIACPKIDSISKIVTHREISGFDYTDCPGLNFPATQIREFIRTYKAVESTPDPLIYKVIVQALNFRTAPNGKILKTLHYGDLVYLKRYVDTEDWSRVRLGSDKGQEGYVWLNYIGKR